MALPPNPRGMTVSGAKSAFMVFHRLMLELPVMAIAPSGVMEASSASNAAMASSNRVGSMARVWAAAEDTKPTTNNTIASADACRIFIPSSNAYDDR